MNSYEINKETQLVIPIGTDKSEVIEKDRKIIVNLNTKKLIDNSCKYFGSSYQGRIKGTKSLIGVSHKAPIIIEESEEIIFFPTTSPRLEECIWIGLKHIKNYKKEDYNTKIEFKNGYLFETNMSYGSFDNQVLRSTRLESVLINRKKEI